MTSRPVALVVGGTGTSGCKVAEELVRSIVLRRRKANGARGLGRIATVAVMSRKVRQEDLRGSFAGLAHNRRDEDSLEVEEQKGDDAGERRMSHANFEEPRVVAVRADLKDRASVVKGLREAGATQVEYVFWFVDANQPRSLGDPVHNRQQLAMLNLLQPAFSTAIGLMPGFASDWFYGFLARKAGSGPGAGTVGWMENLFGAISDLGARLKVFVLCTGGKHYGMHLGPLLWSEYKVPFCEDVHKCPGPMSYFEQQDYITKRARQDGFVWNEVRPSFIVGTPPAMSASTQSLVLVLGMYASVLRRQGKPLTFPGSEESWTSRQQLVTSDKIAQVAVWLAAQSSDDPESQRTRNEAFNVVSCPPFSWSECWDSVAASMKMEAGPGPERRFGNACMRIMGGPDAARETWRMLTAEHDLRRDLDIVDFFEAGFLDKTFTCSWSSAFSTAKLAAAGFPKDRVLEAPNAAVLLEDAFNDLRAARILPP